MGTRIKNTKDEHKIIWYGHTPYPIGKLEVVEIDLPTSIVTKLLSQMDEGHGLEIVIDKVDLEANPSVGAGIPNPSGSEPDPWDPYEAPRAELDEYVLKNNLTTTSDLSDDDLRDIVYEHTIS